MKHPTRHAWLLGALLIAACGSATPPGSTATAPDHGSEATNSPVDAPAAGNAGGIVAPDIVDALYMTGGAHIDVTGQRTLSTDAVLVPGASMSTGGTTLLMYGAGEGENAIVISVSNGPDTGLGFTITAPQVITAGDGSSGCGFEITRNDDAGLAGTFTCRGISTVGLDVATVDVNGSFSAER